MPKGVYVRKTPPVPPVNKPRPIEERLWRHVDQRGPTLIPELGECWIWIGATDKKNYGKIQAGTFAAPRLVQTHRVSYEIAYGPIPTGSNVLHRCDNPPCLRPTHLFVGTYADNARDKVAKGRQIRGENHPAAKLTNEQVREIRSLDWEVTSPGAVAKRYGVSYFTIRKILRGDSYKP